MQEEYLITKISDQKDKKYSYQKELNQDEKGFPLKEEIESLIAQEKDKNIVLIVYPQNILILSYKAESKLKKVFKKIYDEMWNNLKDSEIYSKGSIELVTEIDEYKNTRDLEEGSKKRKLK